MCIDLLDELLDREGFPITRAKQFRLQPTEEALRRHRTARNLNRYKRRNADSQHSSGTHNGYVTHRPPYPS